MKALSHFLVLACILLLAGCGGGGSGNGSSGGAFNNGTYNVTIKADAASIGQNGQANITVTVANPDGSIAANGTTVSLTVSPAGIGTVGTATNSAAGTATGSTSGGIATFFFLSASQGGTAHIVASVANSNSTTSTASVDIAVSATSSSNFTLTAMPATLPLNPFNPEDGSQGFPGNYLGSPYISEVTVTWRHADGTLVSGTVTANVSIAPVTVAGYSILDDPTTQWTGETQTPPTADGNEFLEIKGSGTVPITAGVGTIFVHSFNVPGTATLSVTAVDPSTNQSVSAQTQITVAGATSNQLPGAVTISQAAGNVYISNANGPQSKAVFATVLDGNGAAVGDPNDGQGHAWDNVQFSIIGPAGTDAKLSALNAAGVTQTGTTVNTSTHNGIASVSFQAGAQQGPVQIKATVDRGDNNVDNQIQDAVSATSTVVVSDGKLYSLQISSPVENAIHAFDTSLVNFDFDTGTYAFIMTVTATDRQGLAPAPGTVVRWGLIDAPTTDYAFDIAGQQGSPTPGGTLFNAADGHFLTAGGGAGPGDALVVFGKTEHGAPAGFADLESASKVTQVVSQTQLRVGTAFNYNETTGAVVSPGYVLPYVVGRATQGNVTSTSSTDSFGFASTTVNYPVTSIGNVFAVWAQGNGTDTVNNTTSTVTDAEIYRYPAIAPAQIIVSPKPIPGNITLEVDACLIDAKSNPIPGVSLDFAFTNLGIGSGVLDGISGAGTVPQLTDASGCVATTVTTSGIAAPASGSTTTTVPTLTFSAAGTTGSATIVASTGLILLANPSACGGSGCGVTLTLLNSNGTPVPGVQLTGTCTGDSSIGLSSGPGVTDASGKTTVTITASLDGIGGGKSGSCTFTTSTGDPKATVTLQGQDVCNGVSPQPAGCSTGTSANSTIALTITGGAGAGGNSMSSTPGGLSCSAGTGATQNCSPSVAGGTYTLNSTTAGTWTGSCTPFSGNPATSAKLIVPDAATTGLTCTLTTP